MFVVGAAFIYKSAHLGKELRTDPPPEFFEVDSRWSLQGREMEGRLARAYWECVVKVIQLRYAYGSSLPASPPPAFSLATLGLSAGLQETPEVRTRFWEKLRKATNMPEVWQTTLHWNWSWLR